MTDKLRGAAQQAEREAFERALASRPDARFWNAADAMFWAWQARAALAQQDAQVPRSTSPTALRPYDPTEQMRWAAKQLDPALTHDQIRALWCAMWSAAPTPPAQQDAQAESSIIWQNKLLADALGACILASGIVRKDIEGLTGPQLLLFAEDLREMLTTQSAQQDDTAKQCQGSSGECNFNGACMYACGSESPAVYQDAQAVPPGCKLVPVEPTPEMLRAGFEYADIRNSWPAMLNAAPTPPAQQREPDYTICPTCGGMASDPIVPQEQISDGEFDADKRLMELADKIDQEQNWRLSGIDQRDRLTQEQQDRVTAGVMLRRYADLMAPDSWRLFPPKRLGAGIASFRASTLEKAVEMAMKYQWLNADPAPSEQLPEARKWTGLTGIGVYFAITAAGRPPTPMSEEFFKWCEKFADAIEANLKERNT